VLLMCLSRVPSTLSVNDDQLTVFTLNVGSLRNKFDEVHTLISSLNFPDVVVLTEVWIYTNEIMFYNIDHYVMYCTCNDAYQSGGVIIYVNKRYNCVTNNVSFDTADALGIKISNSLITWCVLGLYRSPSLSMWAFVDEFEIF